MHGFDPEFRDLPDYIIKITERIWEGRGVGLIHEWYARDTPVHTAAGTVTGAQATVAATLETLHVFPDRTLLPEDILWLGDAESGFLSSHRVSGPGTHLGASAVLGPATGRPVHSYAIADCFCVGNQVVEEWLVRDQLALVLQIGLDPVDVATAQALADDMADKPIWQEDLAATLRRAGTSRPPVLQDHPAAQMVRETLQRAWGAADPGGAARAAYHPACIVRVPGERLLYGHERLQRWITSYLASFPDARLHIEHSFAMEEAGAPTRVATRWYLTGTHTGYGAFGPPSGATVVILGITHHQIWGGTIRDEWTIIDEIAVRRQIARHRG